MGFAFLLILPTIRLQKLRIRALPSLLVGALILEITRIMISEAGRGKSFLSSRMILQIEEIH